jgi:hypothetical protein
MWEEIAGGLPEERPHGRRRSSAGGIPSSLYEEDPKWPGSGATADATRCAPFEGYAEVMGTDTFSVEGIAASDDEVVCWSG